MRFRRVTHTLRSATTIAAPRPAYAAGVRGAIATIVPLALGELFGSAAAGTWASLGGFNAALSDRGGDYRTRARTMLAILVASCIAAALGTLATGHLVAALATTFVVAFLASLLRAWGNQGISIGGGALTSYVVALAIPAPSASDALVRAGFLAVGSLWAMAIALVVWPLRPFRPARVAVADCYRVLADYVDQVADDAHRRHTAEWPVQHTPTTISMVRTALETSRAVLVQLRRGRPGAMARGERLLVMNESADQVFGHVVALTDVLSSLRDTAGDGYTAAVAALKAIASTARQLAVAVEDEEHQDPIAITWSGERIRRALRTGAADDGEATHQEQAAIIIDRAAQYAASAAQTVSALNTGRAGEAVVPDALGDASAFDTSEPALWDTFRAALSADSLLARFALRVAVVTTVAVGLTEYFAIPRGYWLTITVIVILQPYTGVTLTRAIQRVAGTVLGGLLAAALGAAIHDERGIMVIATVFVACCIALMPVNYAAYSVFLTPTFVLLAEASAGDWHLASTRVVNTLLGGALALLGARVLWPSPERSRFPAVGAEALRRNAAYLSSVIARFDDRSEEASNAIRAERRAVGIATVNAEESLQRSLAEVHGDERRIAPALTLLAYTRRFTATVAALSVARFADGAVPGESFASLADLFARTFADLAAAVEEGRAPMPLPRFGTPELRADLSPHIRARFERLLRQTRTMHDAVLRMAPPVSPAVPDVVQSR